MSPAGVDGGRHIDGATRDGVRVLRRAISGRDVHDSHASRQPLLRRQPHRSLLPHLRRLVPRLLPAGRVRRQSQSRDNDSSRSCRLPADGRRNHAANSGRHPDTWSVCWQYNHRTVLYLGSSRVVFGNNNYESYMLVSTKISWKLHLSLIDVNMTTIAASRTSKHRLIALLCFNF